MGQPTLEVFSSVGSRTGKPQCGMLGSVLAEISTLSMEEALEGAVAEAGWPSEPVIRDRTPAV